MQLLDKLTILADAAKYDVSCSSSGSTRKGEAGTIGSAAKSGICHSFTADGRCISLLKILMTNNCIYDCAYWTSVLVLLTTSWQYSGRESRKASVPIRPLPPRKI